MAYRLYTKIRLEDKGKIFGDGPCELLSRVEQKGSLRQAAADMSMSYRQAWALIRMLEKNLGFALLKRQAGGIRGGGSSLTREGRELMQRFRRFRHEADTCLQDLFEKHFGDAEISGFGQRSSHDHP